MFKFRSSFTKIVIIPLFILVLFTFFINGFLGLVEDYQSYKSSLHNIENEIIQKYQNKLKTDVEKIKNYINFQNKIIDLNRKNIRSKLLRELSKIEVNYPQNLYIYSNESNKKKWYSDIKNESLLKQIKKMKSENSYISYNINRNICYYQKIELLNLIVFSTIDREIISSEIDKRQTKLKNSFSKKFIETLFSVLLILTLILLLSKLTSQYFQKELDIISEFFLKNTENKKKIDINKLKIKEFHKLASAVNKMIEKRRKDMQRLKDSEMSFRSIYNSSLDAIYIQDFQGNFLAVNKGAEKMYGYKERELIGKTPQFLSAPAKNDLQKVNRCLQLAKEGKPQLFEFWGKTKDGRIFPKIVRVNRGKYFGKDVIIAFALDISKRKEAENKLKKSEKQYRLLAETAGDMILILSTNSRIQYINKAVENISGYRKEEVIKVLSRNEWVA